MNNLEFKKVRQDLGVTQKELASALGVGIRTVQKWEGGDSKISKQTEMLLDGLRIEGVSIEKEKGVKEFIAETSEEQYFELMGRLNESRHTIQDLKDFFKETLLLQSETIIKAMKE